MRSICESRAKALAYMTAPAATSLSQLFATFRACDSVGEFFDLFPSDFDREEPTWNLADGWVIRFRAGHVKPRLNKESQVDWNQVKRIMVIALEQNSD